MKLESAAVGLVDDEAQNLALLNIVETDNANIAVAVFRTASIHFVHHFFHRLSGKHRQLPHRPVVHFWLRGFAEFYCGEEALIQDVLDLTGHLRVRQRGQIRKSFVATFFGQSFHSENNGGK
uniref:Uncharacterized protein n=1 Tax=Desertifilum tharense IPPAS B-1220 TaxID=1781255 RepID=A0A1E5QFP4_9CYAN|nr:hypothetical protein BH720_19445 [Desertifilum tharense IPPAS B-1220]